MNQLLRGINELGWARSSIKVGQVELSNPTGTCRLQEQFYPGSQPGLTSPTPAVGQALTLPASVRAGDKLSATVGDIPAPVLEVQDGAVTLQVPWEAAPGTFPRVALSASDQANWTGGSGSLWVQQYAPRFLRHSQTVHSHWQRTRSSMPLSPIRNRHIQAK